MNSDNRRQFFPKLSTLAFVLWGTFCFTGQASSSESLSYKIVDTGQSVCSDASAQLSTCPVQGEYGFGQDAQYQGYAPSYTANNDGTVSDNVTGLMWAASIDTNGDGKVTAADKMSFDQAVSYIANLNTAGFSDWRLPTIKELYSLILFDGEDPSGINGPDSYSIRPFIDHRYFGFESGDMASGERLIDAQYLSSTQYVSKTMGKDDTVFGVNFIDGRIKGYGMQSPRGGDKTFYILAVRGNSDYGVNQFVANSNGTVHDEATGLIWQTADSVTSLDWNGALEYCENLDLAGRQDWRLPNVKELQSIVDYSRSPATSNSPSIDPVFNASQITNEGGELDYPNYWSSTTHMNLKNAKNASYVAFGRSMGYMRDNWVDVHGAGAQRSDPKVDNGQSYPQGHGPQGDAVRFENHVRCVSDNNTKFVEQPETTERPTKTYTLSNSDLTDSKPAGKVEGKGKSQRRSGDPFADMDTNGDNKLSRNEVRGPLARDFDKLDRNKDGFITRDELPKR